MELISQIIENMIREAFRDHVQSDYALCGPAK